MAFWRKALPWVGGAIGMAFGQPHLGAMAGSALSRIGAKRKDGRPGFQVNEDAEWESRTRGQQSRADNEDQRFDQGQNELAHEIDALKGYDPETGRLGRGRAGDFSPDDLTGYNTDVDPSELRGYRASNLEGYRPTGAEGAGFGELESYNTDGLDGYSASESAALLRNGGGVGPSAAAGFSPDVAGFDPEAAVNRWAQGAWGNTLADVKKQSAALRAQAGGAGRLDTGFYDEDQGDLVKGITDAFGNNLAQTSVQAAQIKANALTAAGDQRLRGFGLQDEMTRSGADNRIRLASTVDRGRLDALDAAGRMKLARAENLGRLRLDRGKAIDDSNLTRASSVDKLGLEQATGLTRVREGNADRGLTRATEVSRSRQRAAEFGDSYALDTARATDATRSGNMRSVVDARLSNNSTVNNRGQSFRDREFDAAAGQSDRRLARENAKRAEKAQKRSAVWGTVGQLGGQVLGHYLTKGKGGGGGNAMYAPRPRANIVSNEWD